MIHISYRSNWTIRCLNTYHTILYHTLLYCALPCPSGRGHIQTGNLVFKARVCLHKYSNLTNPSIHFPHIAKFAFHASEQKCARFCSERCIVRWICMLSPSPIGGDYVFISVDCLVSMSVSNITEKRMNRGGGGSVSVWYEQVNGFSWNFQDQSWHKKHFCKFWDVLQHHVGTGYFLSFFVSRSISNMTKTHVFSWNFLHLCVWLFHSLQTRRGGRLCSRNDSYES